MAANQRVGRAVLELRTDTADFHSDLSKVSKSIQGVGKDIVSMAAGFFTAQAAFAAAQAGVRLLTNELKTLTIHGAAVADVAENFAHLTSQAGQLGETLLTTLRAGTHQTISDFQLMQQVNGNLAAGLRLTEAQYATLSEGAFALAQATGGDVATAMEAMNDAMLTGRTRAVAMLTGKIDLTAAEDKFAKSIGVTAKRLSEEGKLEAARVAIIEAVGAATERLGEQTDGLDERVAQAHVFWTNFENDLGRTIATSSVLEAGMVGVKDALTEAFGNDRQAIIAAIAREVDNAAIAVVGFAQVAVSSAGFIVKEWYAVKKIYGDVRQVIDGVTLATLYLGKAQMTIPNAIGIGTEAWKRNDDAIGNLLVTMKRRGEQLQADDRAQAGVDAATAKFNTTLETLRGKMVAASLQHKSVTDATNAGRVATDQASESNARFIDTTDASAAALKARAENAKIDADNMQEQWNAQAALADFNGQRRMSEIEQQAQEEREGWRRNQEILESEEQQSWNRRAEAADAAGLAELARIDEHYKAVTSHSQASLQQVADAARRNYEAARQASGEFTEEAIEDFKRIADEAQAAANGTSRHWREAMQFWKGIGSQLEDSLIGGIGTLLFGNLGHDLNGQLKSAADEAHQDFLRIQRDGRSTAEELTLAMRRWREAEERANLGFGERWKQFWGGLKQTFVRILDDMLQYFLGNFIKGLIKGLVGGNIAQHIGQALTGGGVGALLGGGASAIAGGSGAAAAVAGVESAAFGGAAAAGGGGIGGSLAAFATNPFTIAAAAGIAIGLAVWKKGLFRGGEEALKVSPRRDKFLGQFGGPGTEAGSGFRVLADRLFALDHHEALFTALRSADRVKEFEAAQAGIVARLAKAGQRVKSFRMGGFVPPGMTVPAVLHGGARGEVIVPLADGHGSDRPMQVHVTNRFEVSIQGWDGEDVDRTVRKDILPRLKQALMLNTDDLAAVIRRTVEP